MRHFDPKKRKQVEQHYLKKIKKAMAKLESIEEKMHGLEELLEDSIKEVQKEIKKSRSK